MIYYKQFDNGLRLVVNRMEGMYSVSCGVLVKTGSMNESQEENGISHFIEHVMFKGTKKRSAFEISDYIDRIGSQINAFTSKDMTCYYTRSTKEHAIDSIEVLSDIFFDSVFDPEELEKEKGVVIEEIKMGEDTPEDLCLDMLSSAYYGKTCLGQTILGTKKNIKSFTRDDVLRYMNKYYTADNVVISIAGNVDIDRAVNTVKELFADRFRKKKSGTQKLQKKIEMQNIYKCKRIEQSHIGIIMKGYSVKEGKNDALAIANGVLGGGMSSRLFQKIREQLGLAYSVYSYPSMYKTVGDIEIYAGVNTELRDLAAEAIYNEVKEYRKNGITEQEFMRGKEQIKSAFIMGQESTASQMLLYAKYLLMLNKEFDLDHRIKTINDLTINDVNDVVHELFDIENAGTATVGSKRSPIKF